jgi:hypothetical protein
MAVGSSPRDPINKRVSCDSFFAESNDTDPSPHVI